MTLSHHSIEFLKTLPFLRTAYCRWRINHYRKKQKSNFGIPVTETKNDKAVWEENIDSEVGFWDSSLSAGRYQDRLESDYLYSEELGAVLKGLKKQKSSIHAIDVGCGPLSTLGKNFHGMTIHRTLVDPLASRYQSLLERLGVPKEDWPEECEGEFLESRYPSKGYDLVYMCNALDHCHNPFEVVRQLGGLVAPGYVLYLEHFENEAEKENYQGLHQWNIYEENGDLWIANRTVKKSLQEILGKCFKIEARAIYRHGGFVVATATRNHDG